MKYKEKFKDSYNEKKPVNIKEVLSKKEWNIDNIEYNDNTGKYEIKATHDDGRTIEIKRNKQYVDNLIKELLDAKQQRGENI